MPLGILALTGWCARSHAGPGQRVEPFRGAHAAAHAQLPGRAAQRAHAGDLASSYLERLLCERRALS